MKKTQKTFYQRWSIAIVVCTLAMVPFCFYAAARAVQSNVNRVEDWLPSSFEETENLAWFRENFASDQFIILSWQGCQLGLNNDGVPDDPRLERLANLLVPKQHDTSIALTSERQVESPFSVIVSGQDDLDRRKYFKSVVTGRHLLDQLTSPPLSLSIATAVSRLRGSMIGPDGRQTCLVVTLHEEALRELKQVLGSGQRRVFRENVPPGVLHRLIEIAGIPHADVRMGGPPVDNNAIDEEGERTLIRLAGLSGLFGLGLAWWSLRSILLTLIVFSCGVISAATSLAIVGMTGQNMDAILMSMPSLVYVLAISGAVHFVNYYRESIRSGGLHAAAERAVQQAWKPAVLCSVTTAVGLLSLSASELVPIRKFGIYSAAGVTSLVIVVYFFLPAALALSGIGVRWLCSSSSHGEFKSEGEQVPGWSERFWGWIAEYIVRHHFLVGAGCVLATLVTGIGLSRTKSSIDLLKLFDSRTKILRDYRWLEDNLGKIVPLEIVVRFPSVTLPVNDIPENGYNWNALSFVQRLETVIRLQSLIDRQFGPNGKDLVSRSLSAASFAPRLPSNSGTVGYVQRKTIDARLSKCRQELSEAGFLRTDADGSELWRISLRVAAFRDVDYGEFVKELKQITQPLLEAYETRVEVLQKLTQRPPSNSPAGKKVLLWGYCDVNAPEQSTLHTFQIILQQLLLEYHCQVSLLKEDPRTIPLQNVEMIGEFAAVVVFGDVAESDFSLLQTIVPEIIDARLPSSMQPEMLQGESLVNSDRQLSAIYTGVVPIVYQAQRALLNSLIESTWWSFLTITPIMMLVSRSFWAGAISMIPNAAPVLWIFGSMGWMGIAVDIGSMMTASIALGVAVDDTIHFLARYRQEIDRNPDRRKAIVTTYSHCAVPTLQAALISGLGLSVFAFSTFTPTQRFGWLMLSILMAGVVSELVLLPALLASPIGKVFRPRRSKSGGNRVASASGLLRIDDKHNEFKRKASNFPQTNQKVQ